MIFLVGMLAGGLLFVLVDIAKPIYQGGWAHLDKDGKAWVIAPRIGR